MHRFRYEHLMRESQMMVARTVAIDAGLRNAAVPKVVILGAGLDGRAWRMRELGRAQEEMGLRLDSAKGTNEVLVIDSVRKPTEN